ncbi:type VI secretion system protein TssA [Marinomonas ostreistagni]|uniref:Type VI secretion system protein TssA n=1 Tax=Marinomonas ostreistagni TaxID=359209 RepID=A0ABS0Z8J0_9GAMM|nr:type VI secretion system protein TssA [Marinomonas ostreistagni]MBJ7549768.1 type VI secretion system protein TssA [Marinomonas ostreistagni]
MDYIDALKPINEDGPTGIDIRDDAELSELYYSLRDLRNGIRAEERKVVQLEDLHSLSGEWRPVREQCLKILTEHTKDVEVLAWLIEASIRLDGFLGLAQSLALAEKMVSTFWGSLYPLPDEDGIQATLYPLSGLNGDNGEGTLIMPIRMSPFMYTHEGEPVLVWDYIKACELGQIQDQDKRKRRIDNGELTVDQLQQQAHSSNTDQIRTIATSVHQARQHFIALEDFLNEQCGFDSPPTSAIKNTLAVAQEAIKVIAHIDVTDKPAEEVLVEELDVEAQIPEPSAQSALQASASFDPMTYYPTSRDEALIMTSRLSLFFENTEPHSPLSHQMKRVERWGRMSLAELMEELLDDDNARKQFFRLIGLNPSSGG